MADVSAGEVVRNGAALLDQHLGMGWAMLVDLGNFDITNGSRCVLAHIVRNVYNNSNMEEFDILDDMDDAYGVGRQTFFSALTGNIQEFAFATAMTNSSHFGLAFGFEARDISDSPDDDIPSTTGWSDLQTEWVAAIKSRQEQMNGLGYIAKYKAMDAALHAFTATGLPDLKMNDEEVMV